MNCYQRRPKKERTARLGGLVRQGLISNGNARHIEGTLYEGDRIGMLPMQECYGSLALASAAERAVLRRTMQERRERCLEGAYKNFSSREECTHLTFRRLLKEHFTLAAPTALVH